jgi:hypothetical protein
MEFPILQSVQCVGAKTYIVQIRIKELAEAAAEGIAGAAVD